MKKYLLAIILLLIGINIYSQGLKQSDPTNKNKKTESDVEWDSYFLPGVQYQTYFPSAMDSLGYYKGISIQYVIYAWIYENDDAGPSHGRIFTKVNILKSSKSNIDGLLTYSVGLDLSLEKNPKRKFGVPFFGFEMGGIHGKNYGNIFQMTPTFGVHIYCAQNLFISLSGGYVYPFKNFEELGGYTAQLGVNLSFW